MTKDSRKGPPRQWSSRSIALAWQHRFFYVLIKRGGRRAAYLFLRLVCLYYILFRPNVRRRTHAYLAHRFPHHGWCVRLLDSYRMCVGMGEAVVDRAALGILGPDESKVASIGHDELHSILKQDQGLILLAAHVGCWQVALGALDFLTRPVNILMYRDAGDIDWQFFEHTGAECPFAVIDPSSSLGGVVEMIACLRRGEVLCVMGDRLFGGENGWVSVDFLGEECLFPFGPFKIASVTGAPIAVALSHRTGVGSFKMSVAKVIHVPPDQGQKAEAYRPYVAEFADVLTAYSHEHPFEFFNFYDMWSPPVQAETEDSPVLSSAQSNSESET